MGIRGYVFECFGDVVFATNFKKRNRLEIIGIICVIGGLKIGLTLAFLTAENAKGTEGKFIKI